MRCESAPREDLFSSGYEGHNFVIGYSPQNFTTHLESIKEGFDFQ